jgi:hypothetical protein
MFHSMQMKRRDMLVRGAVLGAAGAMPACALSPVIAPTGLLMSPDEVEAAWRDMEASRAALSQGGPIAIDRVASRGRSVGRVWSRDDISRKAARTLFLAGAFRDLPEQARAHPLVQESILSSLPEFDEAITGVRARLEALTPTEHADLSREFREDPELAERVMAIFDDEASRCRMSDVRRLHLRKIGVAVTERLAQSSELLIGEYVAKLDKVYARSGSEAEVERRLATAMGEEQFASLRSSTLEAVEAYRVAGVMKISGAKHGISQTKRNLYIAGGVFMGLATIAGIAIAGAAASGGIGGGVAAAFIGTAGGIFLLVGLILFIVGAAIS